MNELWTNFVHGKETRLKIYDHAEYKRRKVANIKRSLAKAIENGTALGRPRTSDYDKIRELRKQGLTYSRICAELNCSIASVQRALRKEL